jgi:ribosomal protein S18 acetylase RimI-like enzyme
VDPIIRECRREDLEAVAAIEREVVEEEAIYGYRPAQDPGAKLGRYFLVAESGGSVVGFLFGAIKVNDDMVVLPAGAKYLEIEDLHVTRDARGSGVGGRLLDRALELAAESGVERALLYSASKRLDDVIRFYRRHGFRTWNVAMYR